MTRRPIRAHAVAAAAALLLTGAAPALAQDGGQGAEGGAHKAGRSDLSVQEAWANAKRDWRALQSESGEAWDKALKDFQESWRELQRVLADEGESAPPPPSAAPGPRQDQDTRE